MVRNRLERPERLLSRFRTMSVEENSGPRVTILRMPRGPDGSRGFRPRRPIAGNSTSATYSTRHES